MAQRLISWTSSPRIRRWTACYRTHINHLPCFELHLARPPHHLRSSDCAWPFESATQAMSARKHRNEFNVSTFSSMRLGRAHLAPYILPNVAATHLALLQIDIRWSIPPDQHPQGKFTYVRCTRRLTTRLPRLPNVLCFVLEPNAYSAEHGIRRLMDEREPASRSRCRFSAIVFSAISFCISPTLRAHCRLVGSISTPAVAVKSVEYLWYHTPEGHHIESQNGFGQQWHNSPHSGLLPDCTAWMADVLLR